MVRRRRMRRTTNPTPRMISADRRTLAATSSLATTGRLMLGSKDSGWYKERIVRHAGIVVTGDQSLECLWLQSHHISAMAEFRQEDHLRLVIIGLSLVQCGGRRSEIHCSIDQQHLHVALLELAQLFRDQFNWPFLHRRPDQFRSRPAHDRIPQADAFDPAILVQVHCPGFAEAIAEY